MKDHRNFKKWMIKASELLTMNEMKVFVLWFDDAPEFSAGASRLVTFLPSVGRANICRALQGLAEKKLLKEDPSRLIKNGKGKPTPFYMLNYEILDLFDNVSNLEHNVSKIDINVPNSTHYDSDNVLNSDHNVLNLSHNVSDQAHVLSNNLLSNGLTEIQQENKQDNEQDNVFGSGLKREDLIKDEFIKELWLRKESGQKINWEQLAYTKTDRVTVVKKFQELSKQIHLDPKG